MSFCREFAVLFENASNYRHFNMYFSINVISYFADSERPPLAAFFYFGVGILIEFAPFYPNTYFPFDYR